MRDPDILRDRTAVLGQLLDHDHVTAATRILGSASLWVSSQPKTKCLERMPPGLLKCWPSYHYLKGGEREAGWWVTCFLVRATRQRWPKEGMLPDPTAGLMIVIGQLTFPQALSPWPPVSS